MVYSVVFVIALSVAYWLQFVEWADIRSYSAMIWL